MQVERVSLGISRECRTNRGVHKRGTAVSNTCNRRRIESHNLVTQCQANVVALHLHGRRVHSCNMDFEYFPTSIEMFLANRQTLPDKRVSTSKRLNFFNAVDTSAACFASGHKAMYSCQLATLNLHIVETCCKSIAVGSCLESEVA